MKSVLVINTHLYPKHRSFGNAYGGILKRETGDCVIVDMGKQDIPVHEKFYMIQKALPEWLISFDLAGFECRLELGEASYNKLPCRMAHLLLKSPEYSRISSEEAFNFSMYFYAAQESWARQLKKRCPNIEHISFLPELNDPQKAEGILRKVFDDTEMSLDFTECRQFGTE